MGDKKTDMARDSTHILDAATLKRIRVAPGTKVRLKDHDSAWTFHSQLKGGSDEEIKKQAKKILKDDLARLSLAQQLLFASCSHSLLIILQAMDAGGKDGTIKHVMSGVNPQGCRVTSFKQPSQEELEHDFLWRQEKALPARGQIGIFNRSHYEEVLVTKVHPDLLKKEGLSTHSLHKKFWRRRYQDINSFERHLARNGTLVLKFFLHISKKTQKERFLERLEDPRKHWKFSLQDLAERKHWKEYVAAYEEALSVTSTPTAPWYIIPADHKWSARVLVTEVIEAAINALDLKYPKPNRQQAKELKEAKQALLAEK
jgi:PPK2 family polyphosphate:nucleotide phosphotransferase